jgi:predicted short-subunit dehydrogenase-like oxidoreductase (DUF2520 family)
VASLDIVVIGRGRAGRALASAWRAAGIRVATQRGRGARLHAGAITVIAVPDPELARVDVILARTIVPRSIVLHLAGSRGPDALPACARAGASTGVMHPLVSFADPTRRPDLCGTTFVAGGPRACVAIAKRLARAVGAHTVSFDAHGPRYHAAAALAANASTALAAVAIGVLCELGMARGDAERAIGGLLRTVGENVAAVGIPRALTGPVVRGDEAAVRAHRAALDPRTRAIYDAVLPAIVAVALNAGLEPKRAAAIRNIVQPSAARSRRTASSISRRS